MEITIYVLAGEEKESRNLCGLVEGGCFRAISKKSLSEFKASGIDGTCFIVLLDLDSVSADSSNLKNLKKEYPKATVITVSSERFHPHLKEAFEKYIYASLVKPLNRDELFFFIESAANDFK